MIIARVVLPRPGGPESRTWSGGVPRRRAASRTRASWSRTRGLPGELARAAGAAAPPRPGARPRRRRGRRRGRWRRRSRRLVHQASGPALGRSSAAAWQRVTGPARAGRPAAASRDRAWRRAAGARGDRGDAASSACLTVQPRPTRASRDLVAATRPWPAAPGGAAGATGRGGADLVAQLEDDALGALAADAGHLGQGDEVAAGDRGAQRVRRVDGEHGQRQPRPDAGDGLHLLEDVALLVGGEPVEGQRVLADDQGRRQAGLAARGAGRPPSPGVVCTQHADPADLDDDRSSPTRRTIPGTEAITRHRDPSAGRRPAGCLRGDRRRAQPRLRPPPRQRWQIARARASAASAGLGGGVERRAAG